LPATWNGKKPFAGIIPLLKSVDSKTARAVRLVSGDCGVMTQFRLTPFFLEKRSPYGIY
jgi:hypothetical protein